MADHRSSLSFAEPSRELLEGWIDKSLSEAVSTAKSTGKPRLSANSRIVSLRLPLNAFDSSIEDVFLFGDRDRVVLAAGVARAIDPSVSRSVRAATKGDLSAWDVLSTEAASSVIVVGGWGFPAGRSAKRKRVWRDFPASSWVVPALALVYHQEVVRLTLAAYVTPSSNLASMRRAYRALLKALESQGGDDKQGLEPEALLPALQSAKSIPSRGAWIPLARQATDLISKGELKKVVLARSLALTFHGKIPPSSVLRRLIAQNPDSTVFAVKKGSSVFLGATPESLVSVRRGEVEVDCLAATSPRSKDLAADETLGTHLLGDSKSRREHEFVVRSAVKALATVSSKVEIPREPVLKKFTAIQHLYTPVRAKLLAGKDVWDAAFALWPNPAIGGEPKEKAVRWIQRSEKFERGWYSGALGLLNAKLDEADLVVGIRSGIIKGRRAVIYAGAGLVAGSEPEEEFEETSWKLGTMGRALGVDENVISDGGR